LPFFSNMIILDDYEYIGTFFSDLVALTARFFSSKLDCMARLY